MEAQLKTTPKAETSRGCGMTPGKPFSWENLLLLGVIACLALSLLTYQYIAAARLLICYVALPLSILLFCILARRHKLLRDRSIHLLLIGLAWILISCILNLGRADIRELLMPVATLFTIALLCYPLALIASKERRAKTFRLLAWLWVVPVFCTTVIAIALVLSGTVLYRADGAALGLVSRRLNFLADPNMYGMLCCMGLSLVFYLLLGKQRPIIRALLVLMALCLFAALSLTDCRSAKIALLIVGFFFAALAIWQLLHKKRNLFRLLIACLAGAAFCAALFFGYRGVTAGTNALISLPRISQNTASETNASNASDGAEPAPPTPNAPTANVRDFSNVSSLRLRFDIWIYALGQVPENWDVLLRGATPALVHRMFIDPETGYNHLHNAYLSVLLSYGIPGFLIMAAFLIFLFVCLCRLLFSPRKDLPPELRLLAGIFLTILAINFVESMLFTRDFISELDVWLAIISGFAVAFSRDYRTGDKDAPAIDA